MNLVLKCLPGAVGSLMVVCQAGTAEPATHPVVALPPSPQEFLPPALPWRGSSEALVAKPEDPWITPSEKTGLTDTPASLPERLSGV
jgi:hypothetical protein